MDTVISESLLIEVDLEFYRQGPFLCIDGPAKRAGKSNSNMKVCFTCCDQLLLQDLLLKFAKSEDCFWVKMSTVPKDGMFLGRCFFTTNQRAAELWATYKTHPRLMVTIQDDDFVSQFRDLVVSWKDKAENALE